MIKLFARRNFAKQVSQINLASTLSQDEYIAVIDENDEPTGEIVTRAEMRKHNLWHRSTSIFVINEFQQFLLNKRSMNKDYCPGWLDTAFGGIISAHEMKNPDLAALREAEEEMGVPGLSVWHSLRLLTCCTTTFWRERARSIRRVSFTRAL